MPLFLLSHPHAYSKDCIYQWRGGTSARTEASASVRVVQQVGQIAQILASSVQRHSTISYNPSVPVSAGKIPKIVRVGVVFPCFYSFLANKELIGCRWSLSLQLSHRRRFQDFHPPTSGTMLRTLLHNKHAKLINDNYS